MNGSIHGVEVASTTDSVNIHNRERARTLVQSALDAMLVLSEGGTLTNEEIEATTSTLFALRSLIEASVDIDAATIRDAEQVTLLRQRLHQMLKPHTTGTIVLPVIRTDAMADEDFNSVQEQFTIDPAYISDSLADMIEAVYMAKPQELKITPRLAIESLKRAFKEDTEYAWSWHCNIAMPCQDHAGVSPYMANRFALNLMRHLFGVDLSNTFADRLPDVKSRGSHAHADRELRLAGFNPDSDDWFTTTVYNQVMELVYTFSTQGHSGWSAGQISQIFHRVINYKLLTPLEDLPEQWSNSSGGGQQNTRLSSVFKDEDGTAYDIDAGPFYRMPSGSCYRRGGTKRQPITFPYMQKPPKYIDVDENDIPVDDVGVPVYRIPSKFCLSDVTVSYSANFKQWLESVGATDVVITQSLSQIFDLTYMMPNGVGYTHSFVPETVFLFDGLIKQVPNNNVIKKPAFIIEDLDKDGRASLAGWLRDYACAAEVSFHDWEDAVELTVLHDKLGEWSALIRVGDTLYVQRDFSLVHVTPDSVDSCDDVDTAADI